MGPESSWAYDAIWAAMSPPNVMVPFPDTDYDIFVSGTP